LNDQSKDKFIALPQVISSKIRIKFTLLVLYEAIVPHIKHQDEHLFHHIVHQLGMFHPFNLGRQTGLLDD